MNDKPCEVVFCLFVLISRYDYRDKGSRHYLDTSGKKYENLHKQIVSCSVVE